MSVLFRIGIIVLGGECRSASAALLIVCELTSIHDDILFTASVDCAITGPCLRMRHRHSARRLYRFRETRHFAPGLRLG